MYDYSPRPRVNGSTAPVTDIHASPAQMVSPPATFSRFQFFVMGLAPFCAGLIGPVLGLHAYFALTSVLMLGGLVLWLRRGSRDP